MFPSLYMQWRAVADTVSVHGVCEAATLCPAGLQQSAETVAAVTYTHVTSGGRDAELVREAVASGSTSRGVAVKVRQLTHVVPHLVTVVVVPSIQMSLAS